MAVTVIDSLDHPGVRIFARLTEARLRRDVEQGCGMFIAESPKVIRVALDRGYEPIALLCEDRHLKGDAADIVARCPEMEIFTGSREVLGALTGYTLTRGVLCAMRRPETPAAEEVTRGADRVAVIDGVAEATNIGAIFRSAAALGVDAVLLTRTSCDPLCRRAVRVSMGSVFLVPWAWIDGGPLVERLHALGLKAAAMALSDDAVRVDDARLMAEARLAIILGTEGDGLSHKVTEAADYVVRIPMEHGVDSLNVAAASAVAFWQLRGMP